jgi:CelD/BcsL family acetyltransferase involved in cellulose biosynthesis
MRATEITTASGLSRLDRDWTVLWERTAAAGPFQHPDWLIPWWRHVGGGELLVLVIRDGDELVGVAPFYIHADASAATRQLTLVGNGVSDCCDMLLDPSRSDVRAVLVECLRASSYQWTSYDLRDLPEGSAVMEVMAEAIGGVAEADQPRVVVPLASWSRNDDGTMQPKTRSDLRRQRRQAEALGDLQLELAAPTEIVPRLDLLFSLHGSRWRARGQEGVLAQANIAAFHAEVAERFARRNWLRLFSLRLGERSVAANYGFALRGRGYSYIGGFAPEYAGLGVGKIMCQEIVRHAASEGLFEFDFLRGVEDYKLRFGGQIRAQYRVRSPSAAPSSD